MTDLAAWIAEKRAASEGAMNVHGWRQTNHFVLEDIPHCPGWSKPTVASAHSDDIARHIAAFPPETTRRLLDAVEALDMLRRESKAYGGTSPAAEAAADAALDALGGGGE